MKTFKLLIWFLTFSTVVLVATLPGLAQHDWTKQITEFKAMVVNIESATEVFLEREEQSVGYATGFIVDAERGIIATNAHVTGISPSYVKINFFDGSFTEAQTLYYDPVHDFGFFKIDPQSVPPGLQEVKLGSWKKIKVGDEVLMIGNNEKEEYSIKFGAIANLNVNKGERYTSYIHTTFDRAGGSSGSPVWDTAGKVVGIHASGNETSSFELPVEYLADALTKIQNKILIKRGGIGIDLHLISTGEAVRHFSFPEALLDKYNDLENGVPKVIQVETVIPQSMAMNTFKAGDILYSLNNRILKDDLYLFDRMLNDHVGETVSVKIYRNGELKTANVTVEDLEATKLRRFVRFGGGIFHDIRPKMRWYHGYDGKGVYLPYSDLGSSFSRIGYRNDENGKMAIIISEVNGETIHNLDDFLKICSNLEDGMHTYVLRHDLNLYNQSLTPVNLSLNLKYGPLELFEWNPDTLEWEKTAYPVVRASK